MTISTITISAVDYTAFASVAEADPYLAVDPTRAAAWAAATTAQKGGFLVAATRALNPLPWDGAKVSASQANAFPRTGMSCTEFDIPTDDVPQPVEDACILLAGTFAVDSSKAKVNGASGNIKKVGAGAAAVEFFLPTAGSPIQDDTAYALIACLIASGDGTFGQSIGTNGTSELGTSDYYGRINGFS